MPADKAIEQLYVTLGADVSELLDALKKTDKRLDDVEKNLDQLEKSSKKSFDRVKKEASGLGNVFQKLQKAASAFIAIFAIQRVVGFFTNLTKSVVGARAEFETFETQFVTLLGSTQAARQRLDELAQFGAETPFNLDQVVEASRVLQVFGGDVLATGDSLRMIGDIAAGVNQPFQDVALWVGRMYDAMQSGRPFGEASARLQEMGALGQAARAELEKLQKEGASGTELWARFNELVGSRFQGNMERLSGTLQGVISNLEDFRDNLMRIGGEPVFEEVREDAIRFLDAISDDKRRKSIENLATALGTAAASMIDLAASPLLQSLEQTDPQKIEALAMSIQDASDALSELLDRDVQLNINGLIDALTVLIDTFTSITNTANTLKTTLEPVSFIIDTLRDAILTILFPVRDLIEGFGALNNIIAQLTGREIVDFSRDLAEASETEKQAMDKRRKAQLEYQEAIAASAEAAKSQIKNTEDTTAAVDEQADKLIDKLNKLGSQLLDLQESTNEQLEENLKDHNEKMAELEQEAADERLEINQKADEKLTKGQAEIFEEAAEELAKLQEETDRDLSQKRDEYNKDELRETEDHLKDMRRLRLDFLDNLEDAVRARDAGRIRDLQKQYARERQEREEDFQTQQGRDREDFDADLRATVEAEDRRAQEIIDRRTKALEELEARIEEARQRDLQQLEAELEKQKQTETENYNARQAELEQALANRLEAEAKALADQDEINEEGAKKILSTLAEYFGEGGEIDKLMEAFASRRRQKLEIEIEFSDSTKKKTSKGGKGTEENIPSFQTGGSLIATRPTLAQFGEVPEMVTFTPLHRMNNSGFGRSKRIEIDLKMSGSAPPGIRSTDRDAIASILNNALREAGFDRV
jgi:hypothetical protein